MAPRFLARLLKKSDGDTLTVIFNKYRSELYAQIGKDIDAHLEALIDTRRKNQRIEIERFIYEIELKYKLAYSEFLAEQIHDIVRKQEQRYQVHRRKAGKNLHKIRPIALNWDDDIHYYERTATLALDSFTPELTQDTRSYRDSFLAKLGAIDNLPGAFQFDLEHVIKTVEEEFSAL